jgi:hypothetical protein
VFHKIADQAGHQITVKIARECRKKKSTVWRRLFVFEHCKLKIVYLSLSIALFDLPNAEKMQRNSFKRLHAQ